MPGKDVPCIPKVEVGVQLFIEAEWDWQVGIACYTATEHTQAADAEPLQECT